MWKRFRESTQGFLLMEAMFSLMILTTITIIILPTLLKNIDRKKQMESTADLHRVLYEASKTWNETYSRKEWEFRDEIYFVEYTPSKIIVKSKEGVQVEVEK